MNKAAKRHLSLEADTYEKAVFSFWFMTALAYNELFDLGKTRFIEAFFEGERSCRVDPVLKSIGIYNGIKGKSTSLIAPEGASTEDKVNIFYQWLESGDALEFFTSRLRRVDNAVCKPETVESTFDTLRLGVNVRNFIETLKIVKNARNKKA